MTAHESTSSLAFDSGRVLPRRFSLQVWLLAALLFVAAYGFMWCYVHVRADMRPCQLVLADPLFALIPHDRAWFWISKKLYTVLTIAAVVVLAYRAYCGDHRPLVRWGTGLTFQAVLRSTTILLLPLCRVNKPVGSVALTEVPMLDLGLFAIPWRVWATNDLVFSGHVGEFILLSLATRDMRRSVRVALIVFQVLQVFALLSTRGHYTIDILLAVPCAFFADAVAVRFLYELSRPRASAAPARAG